MYNPVAGRFLSYPLLHQSLLGSEELHRQLVVRRLKKGLQLVLDEALFAGFALAERRRPRFLLGGAIEGHVVHPKVHLPATLVIHVVGEKVRDEQGFVIECGHQRVGARVGVLDADLDRVILGEAARRRRTYLLLGLSRGHPPVR